MRLVRRATMCVPSTIHALQELSITDQSQDLKPKIVRLIQVWTEYASVLGVSLATSADEDPLMPSEEETFPFRTCALRTCLCRGKQVTHKLRECMGCHVVFYCGKQCQTE